MHMYPRKGTSVTITYRKQDGATATVQATVLDVNNEPHEREFKLRVTKGTDEVPAGTWSWFASGYLTQEDGPGRTARLTHTPRRLPLRTRRPSITLGPELEPA